MSPRLSPRSSHGTLVSTFSINGPRLQRFFFLIILIVWVDLFVYSLINLMKRILINYKFIRFKVKV